jgi:CheY-like chemotaxis protein
MPTQRPTVLVVEDETLIRMAIVMDLEEQGFKVFEACDAISAIDVLDEHPEIRVLFTDVDMPGTMDGLALAILVRDRWPPVQIIVTSGKRELSTDLLPVLGRFLPKPYTPDSVLSAIFALVPPQLEY